MKIWEHRCSPREQPLFMLVPSALESDYKRATQYSFLEDINTLIKKRVLVLKSP